MHMTIDGYGGNPELLGDEQLVQRLLDRLPSDIGMTKISTPWTIRYTGDKPEDWGVTGFVIIAESHISIHTFPEHGQVWADVFSCKEFDAEEALGIFAEEFDLEAVTTNKLDRGLEFPHNVDLATPLARNERSRVTATVGSRDAATV